MSTSVETPKGKSARRWIVTVALVSAVAIAVIYGHWARTALTLEMENDRAKLRAAEFQKVKSGANEGRVAIYDPVLIEMLASDPDCIAHSTTLNVSMRDLYGSTVALRGVEIPSAAKLANVKTIFFYASGGAGSLLQTMKGMPSIEELGFEATDLSDNDVRLLGTFPNLKKVYFAWVSEPGREKLLRATIPGVPIEIRGSANQSP